MANKDAIDYLMDKLKPYLKVDDLNKPIIDFHVRRAKSILIKQKTDAVFNALTNE